MDLELTVEQILDAALDILREEGLDAVSMRNVSARLGVSPVPVYNRIGNKEALLDALAEHLVASPAPSLAAGEPWPEYARRWSRSLRLGLGQARDARLTLRTQRAAYVDASRPLIAAMRAGGVPAPSAVQACRLLTWAIVGFVALEHQATTDGAHAAPSATRWPERRVARWPAGGRQRRGSRRAVRAAHPLPRRWCRR